MDIPLRMASLKESQSEFHIGSPITTIKHKKLGLIISLYKSSSVGIDTLFSLTFYNLSGH